MLKAKGDNKVIFLDREPDDVIEYTNNNGILKEYLNNCTIVKRDIESCETTFVRKMESHEIEILKHRYTPQNSHRGTLQESRQSSSSSGYRII